jgi:hypothetical protein
MANVKISELTSATTALAGTEVLPIVQSSATVKVSVANLTAGRAVSAASLATTGTINSMTVGQGAGSVATNTAVGTSALAVNTSGATGVAIGYQALVANTTADGNTAVGYQAGYTNATGAYNTYVGWHAGYVATGGGNSYLGTTAGYAMTSGAKNTIIGAYGGNQGGLDIRTASNYIVLSDGDGNPRGIFDGSGNLKIGTTSGDGKVRIEGGAGTVPAIYAYNTFNTSGDYAAVFALGNNSNNTSSLFLMCTNPGVANRFVIYGNGTYATVSDQRLKKNIETTRDGYLNDLMNLRVVKYNWTSQADGESKELGVIAQEIEQTFPGLVQESTADGATTAYKQVKTSVLPFMLLKALQELKAEFDAYKLAHP